jgi:enolase
MLNIINGGAHADNRIDIQEFMIIPKGFDRFSEALRASAEVYATLKRLLKEKGLSTSVGDEGGFAPDVSSEEALDLIVEAIDKSGYIPGVDIFLALDVASSEWYNEERGDYTLPKSGINYTKEALAGYLCGLTEKYPIISIEDGMAEGDYQGWKILGETLNKKILLVGDDLFVTNRQRIVAGIEKGIGNAVLLKPNQIGTLTEVKRAADCAAGAGYKRIISHRSGDTADTAIADIGVALGVGMIKSGAPCRAERVEKYNRLLEIEREMTENVPS